MESQPASTSASDVLSQPDTENILQRLLARVSHLDLAGKIKDISHISITYGSYYDIFTGYFSVVPPHGNVSLRVAIKRIRMDMKGSTEAQKRLVKELHVWSELDHPYILPFHGFFFEDDKFPSLVSMWMENGTVLAYLESDPECDIQQMALRIAEGINYLHNNDIIHCNINPSSILVSTSGEPRICGFGLSRMHGISRTSDIVLEENDVTSNVRYMSFELFGPMDLQPDIFSKASDVWAFGMIVIALLTKKEPYPHIKGDAEVMFAIVSGERPPVPDGSSGTREPYQNLWQLCVRCWALSPSARPSMSTVVLELREVLRSQMVWEGVAPLEKDGASLSEA